MNYLARFDTGGLGEGTPKIKVSREALSILESKKSMQQLLLNYLRMIFVEGLPTQQDDMFSILDDTSIPSDLDNHIYLI